MKKQKYLIFVRTKVRAERVKLAMDRVNIQSVTLHGDKSQEEREQAMKSFHAGTIKILITTDVSARGIDVPNVDFVINYDLPDSSETYIHRVGRTGRAGKTRVRPFLFAALKKKHLYDLIESDLMSEIANISIN